MRKLTFAVANETIGILYPSAAIAALDLGLDKQVVRNAAARRLRMHHYAGMTWSERRDLFSNGFGFTKKDPQYQTTGVSAFAGHKHTLLTRAKMSQAKDPKKVRLVATNPTTGEELRFESWCHAGRSGFHRGNIRDSLVSGGKRLHRGLSWKRA